MNTDSMQWSHSDTIEPKLTLMMKETEDLSWNLDIVVSRREIRMKQDRSSLFRSTESKIRTSS